MIFMDNEFKDDERLYRSVFSISYKPNFCKKNGKLSSAAFKKRGDGLSVERGNYREDDVVVEDMRKRFSGNIVFVTVKHCREVEAVVRYLPSENSKYHSEIRNNGIVMTLSNKQAKHLAEFAEVVY